MRDVLIRLDGDRIVETEIDSPQDWREIDRRESAFCRKRTLINTLCLVASYLILGAIGGLTALIILSLRGCLR